MNRQQIDFEEPDGATPLEHEEREGLRFSHVSTRAELNELEQANIEEGLRWLSRQRKPDVLSEKFIRQLHIKLFGDVWKWAGQFRKTEKSIGIDPHLIGTELKKFLDDVQYWVDHQTYPAQELAMRFHHRLVWIHLFPNGNGRHARVMTDALLEKVLGQAPVNWRGSEEITESQRRQQYIEALRKADARDYRALLAFVE